MRNDLARKGGASQVREAPKAPTKDLPHTEIAYRCLRVGRCQTYMRQKKFKKSLKEFAARRFDASRHGGGKAIGVSDPLEKKKRDANNV